MLVVFIMKSFITWKKKKKDEFISVCPNGKPALCLEDFSKFSGRELQGILKHYHENIEKK